MDQEPLIRQKFEDCLIEGLKGQPVLTKDGPVIDPDTERPLMGPPDASFLSVVRAYLKDLVGPREGAKIPQTGAKAKTGLAAIHEAATKLPFGRHVN